MNRTSNVHTGNVRTIAQNNVLIIFLILCLSAPAPVSANQSVERNDKYLGVFIMEWFYVANSQKGFKT